MSEDIEEKLHKLAIWLHRDYHEKNYQEIVREIEALGALVFNPERCVIDLMKFRKVAEKRCHSLYVYRDRNVIIYYILEFKEGVDTMIILKR